MWQQYREYRVKFLQTDEVTVDLASEIAPMSEVNQSLGLGLGLGGSAFINSNSIRAHTLPSPLEIVSPVRIDQTLHVP